MRFFYLRLIFLFVFLHAATGDDTRFDFHSFSAEDENIKAFGDAAHHGNNRSFLVNGRATQSRGSCGALQYGKKVRIQDVATGRVASLSTSFSFAFTTLDLPLDNSSYHTESSGFAFVIFRSMMFATMDDYVSEVGGLNGPCKYYRADPSLFFTRSGCLVVIGTDYNPNYKEPSNNYIRIGKTLDYGDDDPKYTHNLCSNDTHCSYFSDGKIFTVWIDFNSSSQTLEVRLANGSNPSVKKPLQPLLRIDNYTLPELLGDDVILTFWGSTDVQRVEAHELLSWSFFSTEISESNVPHSQFLIRVWKARTWAGISTGVLGMVVAAAIVILWSISRLASSNRSFRYTPLSHSARPHVFSYAELRMATENFDEKNLLGIGGSGSVYKGSFEAPGGVHFVAVKQINFSQPKQAESLFQAEVASLGQIRHRNVVQLQGWCQEKGHLLLVYDFMPNGDLNEWLHARSANQEIVLTLKMRQSILGEVGSALEYLHEDCTSCVLHRDIKSSNVLLDADFVAHLGDFGLARLMDHHKLDKTTLAAGTLGYMAPEMPYTGKATKESDVYSFGILVLEVVCGRRPLDMQALEPEDLVLLHMVWRAYEVGSLLNVVDPRLLQTLQSSRTILLKENEVTYPKGPSLPLDFDGVTNTNNRDVSTIVDVDVKVHKAMVVDLLRLGLLCCLPNPKSRPSMNQVNGILQQIRDMENLSTISNIAMPSLPTTKPIGLYHSLEFSQTSLNLTPHAPLSMSSRLLGHAKSCVSNSSLHQNIDSLYKDD